MSGIRERLTDIHGQLVMVGAALEGLAVLNDHGPRDRGRASPAEARASNGLAGTLEITIAAHAQAVESLDDLLITLPGDA